MNKHGSEEEDIYSISCSPVKFTIGGDDSSDSEIKVSAPTTSKTNGNANRHDITFPYDNPWHKYHFKSDKSSGSNGSPLPVDNKKQHKEKECRAVVGDDDDDEIGLPTPSFYVGVIQTRRELVPLAPPRRISENGAGPSSKLNLLSFTTRMGENSDIPDLARLSQNDFLESWVSDKAIFWGKLRIFVACAIVQILSELMISLQAPFYPFEAEKKGANATSYAFVFSVFELTAFFVTPIFGSKIYKWNPKIVFNVGIFTAATSSIIFGVLDNIVDEKYFIAACALVRAVEAVGEAAVVSSSFAIVASAFHESISNTAGLILGLIVGSLLHSVGGYPLPFMVVGGLLLIAAAVNFFIFPSSQIIAEFRSPEPVIVSCYDSFRLLRYIPVLVSGVSILIGAMGLSYLHATLEPHLRQFQLSQISVGAIMTINGGAYAIATPLFGLMCSKISQMNLVAFCGFTLIGCGYSLIGPIPILPFAPKVWLVALGLVIQGIGLSAVMTASNFSITRLILCKYNRLPDTAPTCGLLSSLWTSMFSLGSFIGPILAGILYDLIGFPAGTLSIVILSGIMMFVLVLGGVYSTVLVLFVCISDSERDAALNFSENEPLLTAASSGNRSLASPMSNTEPIVHHHSPPPQPESPQPGPSGTQRQTVYGSV